MNFELNWPSGFKGEDENVDGRMDGLPSDRKTICSPMSLWLR